MAAQYISHNQLLTTDYSISTYDYKRHNGIKGTTIKRQHIS